MVGGDDGQVVGPQALPQVGMVVLDGTIVSIALPAAQEELGISDLDRAWVVTSYALAFGALLLLGGRIADYWGRKRSFIVGMAGFAVASGIGGIAPARPPMTMFCEVARLRYTV